MSKTIDQKVVEMQFDNKQFERNVSTTMSSVEKLKQSLNFTGASKGLENISASVKKVDMNGLGSAVEAVRVKFSALEVMGVTALANLTNSAVNAGKKIVSALTIDPIKTGFQEYETQINAVQTILANTESKGSTLSDVNAALNELNTYADQTIYNFTEMTRNIGTFTAAGVDLDKSVTSIKGIANLAAVSGSTSQQASTAMYQLSQALAAGKVQLMDWNSVVNAGMGGELFQTALKRTATQMGTNVDALIKKYGSFRESLTKGEWLTADVLTETLTQLSGAYTEADLIAQGYSESQAKEIAQLAQTAVDAATKVKTFTQLWDTLKEAAQSGWTKTWEILVGDFEEAKDLLTELSDTFGEIIGKSADARNTLLYDSMTSNWKKITDGITEAGLSADDFKDKVMQIAKSEGLDIDSIIADYGSLEAAFKNGAISSDILDKALVKMTGTSEEISKKMDSLKGKYKTNKDLLDALTKAGYEQSDIQELITKDTEGQTIALNDLSDAQLMSIGYTAEQVQSIRELSNYAELAGGSLKKFIDNVAVPQGRELLIDALRVSLRSLISICEAVGKAWREVFPPVTSDQVLNTVQSFRDLILSLRPSTDTLDKIQRTFRGLFSILSIGKQAISALLSPIGTLLSNFTGMSGGILDVTASFGDWLYSLNESIKAGNSFAVIGDGISAVLDKIFDTVHYVIDGMGGLSGVFSSVGKGVSAVFEGILDVAGRVVNWIRENITAGDIFAGLAGGGIAVLAKKLSGLVDKLKDLFNFGGDNKGGAFSELLESVHSSLESFQQGIKVASLVGIATAVTLLVSAIRKLSEIDAVKVGYSLVAIRLLIASLNSGFKSLSKTLNKFNAKGTLKASVAMMAIATAVNTLADAMVKFKDLSWGEILKGLAGVGGAMVALSASIRLIGKGGVTLRTSVAILALAQACKMLSESFQAFGSMQWDEIGKGLVAMGGALAEFTAVLAVLSKVGGGKSFLGAASLLVAVHSLDEISENLERLGNLSWDTIGRGLAAMGGALAEFTAALAILGAVGGFGSLLGGTAILIAVQSLDEISENLKRLGDMQWDEIGRGLTAMGGALLELGVVSGLLGTLTGFSGLLGAATLLVSVQSLGKLADALQKFGSMAWDEIGRGLTAMGGALLELGVVSGLLGTLTNVAGLVGAGTILLAVQGLDDLANALQKFGSMSWDEIGRGLVAMGGALLELGVVSGLLGTLTGIAGLVGAGTILLAVQGLDQLAESLQKFGSMSWDEIGRGLTAMGAALGETALGGLLNTFSGFGASAISKMAEPLGTLADSIRKWQGISVPEELGMQIGSLAAGIEAFTFSGWGADAISTIAVPIGLMADSIRKWQGISVPETLGAQLTSLATGVSAFNFSGWGADALSIAAPSIGDMADAIRKWQTITVPEGLGTKLEELAGGVSAFSFAFIGGWSISSLVEPLGSLAGTVSKWNGVTIPVGIGSGLQELADGVGAFNFSFFGGWSIDGVVEPLANLADSVKKWSGVSLYGVGSGLTELANGLSALGEIGVKGIVKEFDGAADKVITSVNEMLSGITNTVNTKQSEVISAFERIMTESIKKITSKKGDFINAAGTLVTQFSNTIRTKSSLASTAFISLTTQSVSAIRGQYSSFYSAGSFLVEGLAAGIQANTSTAVTQARNLASKVLAATKTVLEINSPSQAFFTIGNYVVAGLVNGIQDRFPNIESTSTRLGNSVINAVKTTLGINSPSVVMNEMGHYVVQGLATGIAKDMTAEQAAAQKAQNIVSAFQAELSKFEMDASTADLKYQLWEKMYGDTATGTEKARAEMSLLSNKLQIQSERVKLSQDEYQTTLDTLGASSEKTQEAYNKMLQEQINLADLSGQLKTAQENVIQQNQSALQTYNDYLNKNKEALLKAGFSIEEIEAAAAERSGYNPTAMMQSMSLDVQEAVANSMQTVQVAYQASAQTTFGQIVANSTTIGANMANAIGTGLQNGTPGVVDNTSAMLSTCTTRITEQIPAWNQAGAYLIDGLIVGMQSKLEEAAKAAAEIALAAYNAALSALGIHSPSKKFAEIGMYADLGFAKGLKDYADEAANASSEMANRALSGLTNTVSKIADVINGDIDAQPTIRPVLDLTNIEAGTSKLNALFSRKQAMSISSGMNRNSFEDARSNMVNPGTGSTFQFTQNNYSPKALSRVEIYRQTRNQLSTLERMSRK